TLSETMGHYSVAFTLDTYAFALTDMKEESAKRIISGANIAKKAKLCRICAGKLSSELDAIRQGL
ncbi:MAG: hypothetical protein IKG87_16525, partial [Clostridia bacterium]|nr:hypothetical protein [Clostridia bacterium]